MAQLFTQRKIAYLLLILATLFWSGNFVLGQAMSTHIPPVTMAYWRWQIALLVLLPFTAKGLWQQRQLIKQYALKLLILALLGVAFFNTFVYLGLQSTKAINALLINSTIPIWIVILAMSFIKEPVTSKNILGVIFSLIGVVFLIVRGDFSQLVKLSFNFGDIWVLVAALTWASYTLLLKHWKPQQLNPFSFLSFTVIVGVVVLAVVHWFNLAGEPAIVWKQQEFISIGYFALFPSIVSFACWNEGVARIGAPTAGHFIHLMPPLGIILSILFLNESIHLYHLIGGLFIAIGIFIALRK